MYQGVHEAAGVGGQEILDSSRRELTRDGIKAKAAGRPCDLQFNACFTSPEFLNLLQPRFAPPPAVTTTRPPGPAGGPVPKRQKGEMPSKGAGKGFQRVPSELLAMGCVASTPKGHRLCFDANLKRCELQVTNQRCPKGLHLCAVKGCRSVQLLIVQRKSMDRPSD